MKTALEVKELSYSYAKRPEVLRDISFSIRRGSITAILGRNGCGKSTLLDCLIGYLHPKKGSIYIAGREISQLSERDLARNISYVEQNARPEISYLVRDYLSFGRTAYLGIADRLRPKDWEIVEREAEHCGISHLLGKEIDHISYGERQLCMICRALVQESGILLLDEPVSFLDFGNQYRVLNMMRSLTEEGKTVLFTTHNPNQLQEMHTDVIALHDGNILAQGTSNIIDEVLLEKIYGLNFHTLFVKKEAVWYDV